MKLRPRKKQVSKIPVKYYWDFCHGTKYTKVKVYRGSDSEICGIFPADEHGIAKANAFIRDLEEGRVTLKPKQQATP